MTKQELFDKVVTALIAQGRPSQDEDGNCVYRSPNGLKCAAGHLIPDHLYSPSIEGLAVGHPSVVCRFGESPDLRLLEKLQAAHDDCIEDPDWLQSFINEARAIAEANDLSAKALGQNAS